MINFYNLRVDLSFTGCCAEVICISGLPGKAIVKQFLWNLSVWLPRYQIKSLAVKSCWTPIAIKLGLIIERIKITIKYRQSNTIRHSIVKQNWIWWGSITVHLTRFDFVWLVGLLWHNWTKNKKRVFDFVNAECNWTPIIQLSSNGLSLILIRRSG